MTRLVRAFLGFVVGLLLGGYVSFAFANYPSSERFSYAYLSEISGWQYGGAGSQCAAAVAARNAYFSGQPAATYTTYTYDAVNGSGMCKGTFPGSSNESGIAAFVRSYYCPDGGTLSQDKLTCVVDPLDCPSAGTAQSSGWFLMGNSPSSSFPGVTCAGNCLVSFNGYAPAGQAIVGGQTQYYARGTWQYLGPSNTCSGSDTTPSAQSSLPPDTCGPNQYYGTINGKPVCIDATTGQPANTNPAPTPSTTTTDKTTTTNPDGSTTDTTTTSNPDGSTTTTTTTTQPNGNSTTTTTTTPPPNQDPTKTFCEENPDSPMCEEIESGTPADTGDLYTPETRTVSNVLNDFKAKVQGAPFYSGAVNFLSISAPGGSCGGMTSSISVGWGQNFAIDLDSVLCGSTAQLVYSVLGIGVMLAAAWVAFRIAIL